MADWAAALAAAALASFFALMPANVALACASSSAVTTPTGLPIEIEPPGAFARVAEVDWV